MSGTTAVGPVDEPGAGSSPDTADALLALAPSAELAGVWDRGVHRHHLGVLAVDLGARGRLSATEAGEAAVRNGFHDWVLTVRDTTGDLRPHERAFLVLVADTPGGLVSHVRARHELHDVFVAMRDDVVERGWLHHTPGLTTRTEDGRRVHADLRALRRRLEATPPSTERLVRLLPLACAVGLGNLWMARLGRRRPPVPDWLVAGNDLSTGGWSGAFAVAGAVSSAPGRHGSVVPGNPSSFSWPPW